MFSLSSPLALKGQLKLSTTILLVIFLFTLYITSCEARHIRINGKYSSNKSSLPSKDATEVGDTKKQMGASLTVHDMGNTRVRSTINQPRGAEAASTNPSGDSSRSALRKRIEGIEDTRERSVLEVEFNREQVGSKATTAYTAETLAAMDYPVAHPAPAVHNR